MRFERSSGILLHPTSLPGPYGIGDLGSEAYQWIDFLVRSGCSVWQVLPLGPTGYGDSPYQSFSAFAGNPYLVSPDLLMKDKLLLPEDLQDAPAFPADRVEYGPVINWKLTVLDRAYSRFQQTGSAELRKELAGFQASQSIWLDDFCLFMALKEAHQGKPWFTWELPLRQMDPDAIALAKVTHAAACQRHAFRQFLFFRQWLALRAYARQNGILLVGDAPIFVAHDSADVWAHPELFYLNPDGLPSVVAGVPPDYFSPTGQLWGNPLYRWNVHATDGYAWWLARLKAVLQLVDVIRLDHFRGFAGYWEIPAGNRTAEKGRWVKGPGADFFMQIQQSLGDLPIIAEDLGEITPDVFELRDQFNLPGMKILQFAFASGPEDKFLPHNYEPNYIVYTGTHDNDTSLGWFRSARPNEQEYCQRYLRSDERGVVWEMIRAIWASVAVLALAPMQDFLNLGTEARMNFPGRAAGNWSWRMPSHYFNDGLISSIKDYNYLFGRQPRRKAEDKTKPAKA